MSAVAQYIFASVWTVLLVWCSMSFVLANDHLRQLVERKDDDG